MSLQLILLLFTSMSIAISGKDTFKFIYLYVRNSVQEREVSFLPLLTPDITPYSRLVQSSSLPWNLFLQVAFSKVLLTLWVPALQCFIGSRNLGIFYVYLHATQTLVQPVNVIIHTRMYTRVNKNPSAWNFLSPKPEVTCGTVAIIIWVFYFPHICAFVPFLCLPFITINHTTYILTEDDNTFA